MRATSPADARVARISQLGRDLSPEIERNTVARTLASPATLENTVSRTDAGQTKCRNAQLSRNDTHQTESQPGEQGLRRIIRLLVSWPVVSRSDLA